MYNSNYNLTPDNEPKRRRSGLTGKLVVAILATIVLVFGAMYAPLLWQSAIVAAQPAALAQPAQPAVPLNPAMVADQDALAALYDAVAPSVVSIQVESNASSATSQMPDIPGFQLPPDLQLPNQQQPVEGEGSGFIFDHDGHIVTNNHVVEGATKVMVVFNNGLWAKAEVVSTDPQADLAVIKVTKPEGMDWKPLALANDSSLKVGHSVIAIGNPFGLESTMTTGIVSALGRSFPTGAFGSNRYSLPDVIQTDAAINPGNSGGPLLDLSGNVVGVNFAIESPVRSNSGVGFSIPVSIVRRVVPELIKGGAFKYAYLGLQGNTISPALADALGLSQNKLGVYVSSVVPGGPAEKGGIKGGSETVTTDSGLELQKGGDIVVAIGDQPVRRFEDIVSYLITKAAPGDKVTLTVLRDSKEQKLDVTLGERPAQVAASSDQTQNPNQGQGQGEAPSGQINARAAISIAEDAAKQQGLTGNVTEKVATPDQQGGKSVWVVELSTATQKATVVVDGTTGEVIHVTVQ